MHGRWSPNHTTGDRDLTRPKILYTADLAQPPKGPHILARAFNEIHRACPSAILQLAGPVGFDPPGIKRLLELVEPEARPAVQLIGPGALRHLPRLYAEAATTVLPSLDEPFGLVLAESLASGTPVTGTNSGTIPEIISDTQIGTLFERTEDPVASARGLATAILHTLDLARDPHAAARCSQHARRWTWNAVGRDFDRLHDEALASRGERLGRSA